jgi:hypothetical protein
MGSQRSVLIKPDKGKAICRVSVRDLSKKARRILVIQPIPRSGGQKKS